MESTLRNRYGSTSSMQKTTEMEMSGAFSLVLLVVLLAVSSPALSETENKEHESSSEETSTEYGLKSDESIKSEESIKSDESIKSEESHESVEEHASEDLKQKHPEKGADTAVNIGNMGGLIPPIDVNVHTDINSPHDNKDGHGHGHKGHHHGHKGGHGHKDHDDHDDDDDDHHGDKDHHGNKGHHGDKDHKHHGGGGEVLLESIEEVLGQAKPMPILPEKHGHGNKLGDSKKKLKKKKKKGASWLPLLFIPLLIQAKIIPFIVFKLKMLATKALIMGKLALLILAFNVIRTAYLGSDNIDSQYEKEVQLAKEHYGYTGMPEYGAWINRREDDGALAYRAQYKQHQ